MGKCAKVIVCGMKGVGKTSILEQVIYGNVHSSMQFYPTIEDIYVANIESDRGIKEKVRFYDTAGLEQSQISTAHVYDTDKPESLDVLISLKKDIDKNKDKKEVITVVIGNKTKELDASEYDSTLNKAVNWCSRERIKHFCASAMQRTTLFESFIFLTSKLNPPPSKSTFPQLSMGKKVLSKET
ncbi:PREDICTED: NF-kappa-B inhibitor-interacting Ras-like protein isoform X2 [Nicrophorus vespilloides]|uniref:NF-kappa-B inhibitor-interacting Ras-like protein isoform X2 n=1 Tax=Nicrophorus vespilloides TaxID=110193 RepID=A0ABM1MPU0_NICVS|nr:PREDICTED: NF-kappa-B inhibitor-interacting Ras-like protein isoform X2 [Nicrophorus vespilloides]